MDEQDILFEIRDGVAVITLHRPEHKNAFSGRMGLELGRAYTTCDQSDDVRAVVLTGAGDAFCAGFLLGIIEGWETKRCQEAGVCVAAACLMDPTCTGGVKSLGSSIALGKKYKFHPPLERDEF